MKNRMVCLLIACLMLVVLLSACDDDAYEMTAVTMDTEETAEASSATEESAASEVTEAPGEQKNANPAQTNRTTNHTTNDATLTPPDEPPTEAPALAPTETPTEANQPTAQSQPPMTEASLPETETPTETQLDLRRIAVNYIGSPVSFLYNAIGEPPYGSTYDSNSILGDGEDGTLFYNGFVVYTYRENGVETVVDVD